MNAFQAFVLQWCVLFGMEPVAVEARLLYGKICQATYDGYGRALIECDPRQLRQVDMKAVALHEVAHVKLRHAEDGRSDKERHKDPAFKAILRQGKELWP